METQYVAATHAQWVPDLDASIRVHKDGFGGNTEHVQLRYGNIEMNLFGPEADQFLAMVAHAYDWVQDTALVASRRRDAMGNVSA